MWVGVGGRGGCAQVQWLWVWVCAFWVRTGSGSCLSTLPGLDSSCFSLQSWEGSALCRLGYVSHLPARRIQQHRLYLGSSVAVYRAIPARPLLPHSSVQATERATPAVYVVLRACHITTYGVLCTCACIKLYYAQYTALMFYS